MADTFKRGVIVIDFLANQNYIAKNLCENRDKPQMNCCGKCQLKKRLNQENKKDSQLPTRKGVDEVLFCSEISLSNSIQPVVKQIKHPRRAKDFIPNTYFDIFHPPQV
jgi:hypothetical protein